MKASIIIPTMGRSGQLINTLNSIQNQSFPSSEYQIIVVNNNTTDAALEDVRKANTDGKKEIIYVKEPVLGLHNARHAGARASTGEILAYTDDDVICHPEWLAELVKVYTSTDIGCAGGRVQARWAAEPPEWIAPYLSYLSLLDWGEEIKELKTPLIFGCNFSIRRSLLFKLGGFNPEAFGDIWLGDGETGLLRKVLADGYKIIYNPGALVWHIIPESRLTLRYMKLRLANQGATDSYQLHRARKDLGNVKTLMYAGYYCLNAIKQNLLAMKNRPSGNHDYYEHALLASKYSQQCSYELRMVFSQRLRELVQKEDWINGG